MTQQVKIITYVLDDDFDDLALLKEPLEKVCGCDLELYTDAAKFIEAIELGGHICIIDHQLTASADGIEIGKKVLEKNEDAFLILFSGSAREEVWQRAMNAGFQRGVNKNAHDAFEQIAVMVEKQLPVIRRKISNQVFAQSMYKKYEKHL